MLNRLVIASFVLRIIFAIDWFLYKKNLKCERKNRFFYDYPPFDRNIKFPKKLGGDSSYLKCTLNSAPIDTNYNF